MKLHLYFTFNFLQVGKPTSKREKYQQEHKYTDKKVERYIRVRYG